MKEKIYSSWQIIFVTILHLTILLAAYDITELSYGLSEGRVDLKEKIILFLYFVIPTLGIIAIWAQQKLNRKYGYLLVASFIACIYILSGMVGDIMDSINFYRLSGLIGKSELFSRIFEIDMLFFYVPILISFAIQIWMFRKIFSNSSSNSTSPK